MNLSGLTDNEIWTSFKNGDSKALSFIYAENSVLLYRYGLKVTSETFIIEDTIQDLFSDLIKNRKNLGFTDNINFYLLKAFRRKLIRRLQKEKRLECSDSFDWYKFDIVWSAEHNIIAEETARQKTELLLNALKFLTPRQKEAIYLRFTREMDYNSIAGIMEISEEACRNLISKAIKRLKKSISMNGQNLMVLFQLIIKPTLKI